VQTLIKVLDSFLVSYWFDYISSNKADWEEPAQQSALLACISAHGYPKQPVDLVLQMQED
jgi:hypothetical protein